MSWKVGKQPTTVVSAEALNTIEHNAASRTGHAEVAHYGGFLIAESVPPELAPLIATLPDLIAAVNDCLTQNGGPVAGEEDDPESEDGSAWSYVMVRRVDFDALATAWRKATGTPEPSQRT